MPNAIVQALAVMGEHRVGQHGAKPIEVGAGHGVLEPRQRRLRSQGRPVERIAVSSTPTCYLPPRAASEETAATISPGSTGFRRWI